MPYPARLKADKPNKAYWMNQVLEHNGDIDALAETQGVTHKAIYLILKEVGVPIPKRAPRAEG